MSPEAMQLARPDSENRSPRRFTFLLYRHGEQEDRWGDRALSPRGITQVHAAASDLINYLQGGNPKNLFFESSDRFRAIQTREILHDDVASAIAEDTLKGVTIVTEKGRDEKTRNLWETASTLNQVIEQKDKIIAAYRLPNEEGNSMDEIDPYTAWHMLPDKNEFRIETPREMGARFVRFFSLFDAVIAKNAPQGADNIYVDTSHESTLGAIMKYVSGEQVHIANAEAMQINTFGGMPEGKSRPEPVVMFRNLTYPIDARRS